MRTFKQLFFLVAIAIYNAICTVTGGVHLKKLIPTGVITQGILGGFSGKVGPVVGGKWKDIDYMRSYVIPANPNTASQQTVRAKFSALVALGRSLLSSILQPYWDPFYSGMSGFNAWISENYSLASSVGAIDETAIMAKGTLESTPILTAEYATGTGVITGTFSEDTYGNGELTDALVCVFYDSVNKIFTFSSGVAYRDSEAFIGALPTGLTATNCYVWIFFTRGTGSELIVSDSAGFQCTAP